MPESSRQPRYRVAPGVASSALDGEVTILDPRSGVYFGLEDVSAEVWALLSEPRTVEQLCDSLLERYDVPRGECTSDVSELLTELTRHGLVETV